MPSKSIHVAANFHYFFCWVWYSIVCVYTYIHIPLHLLYLFIFWWTVRFLPYLITVYNVTVNIRVQYNFWISAFVFFGYISMSAIGGSIFSFLRNWHTFFHSDCTNLHSHQQDTVSSISSHPHQHLLLVNFWMIAILTGMVFGFAFLW